jgi:hypothetical protein
LSFVLALGAISLEPVPLTLTFQGVTVAGYVTTPEKFHDHWWQTIIEPGAISYNPGILEAARTTYIHLRDARLYPASGGPMPPFNQPGIYWRGKLSALEGYALGRQTPNGWELPPHLLLVSREDEEDES